MPTECLNCKGLLVSATEVAAGACLGCYPEFVKLTQKQQEQITVLAKQVLELQELCEDACKKNDGYVAIVNAELNGAEAARRGAPPTDNPLPPDSEERKHWDFGWNQENLSNSFGKLRALMLWTTEHLAHVREIAKGYGHDEIATKLELVFTKVSPYLTRL